MGIWLAAVTAARQAGASSILILSDCLRAIDCLTRKNGCRLEGNSLVQDVLRRLRDLALPIFIKYTPSKQTEGNRRADSAARTAAVHGLDAELAVPVAREALSGILANRLSARSDQQYELEAHACPFCDAGEQEDIMHFLYRCHRWCVQRQPLKAAVLVRGLGWPVLHGDALIRDRSLANAVELFISSTRRLEKGNPAEMT
ncbi:hypothetical protein FOL47_001036 [Perkinsus chesapeaki]|uniref:RNase H type-1 domain-containing protein n=1 Tax=Perkinsus chesapeaki TaxID=330153 RepID=A0A7J6KTS4_PERCH|nr:hypothetical protein FOL47_001036 [Perkinsus chesapeaki]